MRILIQTIADDMHAGAVAAALESLGAEVIFSVGTDVPTGQTCTCLIDQDHDRRLIERAGATVDLGAIDLVWSRRAQLFATPDLHPDDIAFANREFSFFLDGFWARAAPAAVWVNPWAARKFSNTKLNQFAAARDAGFRISPTLFSHDPDQIAAFVGAHDAGKVVFKTLTPAWWQEPGIGNLTTSTSIVTPDLLDDRDALRLCPGIYQVLIEKAAELRVTVMGDAVHCVEVLAGSLPGAAVDWRVGQHEMRVRPFVLPAGVEEKCRAIVRGLGLAFGCIDLILGKDGGWYFLEVNEMGQFLWVENMLPEARYLEAFVRFLLREAGAGEMPFGFELAAVRDSIAYRDIMAGALAQLPAEGSETGRREMPTGLSAAN
jgi:glutathione synthase/RimK-type ligase-like ATP-grasp enzyme